MMYLNIQLLYSHAQTVRPVAYFNLSVNQHDFRYTLITINDFQRNVWQIKLYIKLNVLKTQNQQL